MCWSYGLSERTTCGSRSLIVIYSRTEVMQHTTTRMRQWDASQSLSKWSPKSRQGCRKLHGSWRSAFWDVSGDLDKCCLSQLHASIIGFAALTHVVLQQQIALGRRLETGCCGARGCIQLLHGRLQRLRWRLHRSHAAGSLPGQVPGAVAA